MKIDKNAILQIIEYFNNRFNSSEHGQSYWKMPNGTCITIDVGYAHEWWCCCAIDELENLMEEKMAKRDEMTIDMTARITISEETVERCLKLIEMWLNDNIDMCIAGGARHEDGKITPFTLERRK